MRRTVGAGLGDRLAFLLDAMIGSQAVLVIVASAWGPATLIGGADPGGRAILVALAALRRAASALTDEIGVAIEIASTVPPGDTAFVGAAKQTLAAGGGAGLGSLAQAASGLGMIANAARSGGAVQLTLASVEGNAVKSFAAVAQPAFATGGAFGKAQFAGAKARAGGVAWAVFIAQALQRRASSTAQPEHEASQNEPKSCLLESASNGEPEISTSPRFSSTPRRRFYEGFRFEARKRITGRQGSHVESKSG